MTRRIADETLIVPIAGGVGDLDAIYTLNAVGARIWQLLETPTTVGKIVEAICAEFDVAAEDAERDVAAFVDALARARLLRA